MSQKECGNIRNQATLDNVILAPSWWARPGSISNDVASAGCRDIEAWAAGSTLRLSHCNRPPIGAKLPDTAIG